MPAREPLLSVITAIGREDPHLPQALESLRATAAGVSTQWVAVCDGVPRQVVEDATAAQDMGQLADLVVLDSLDTPAGVGPARTRGLAAATGRYVMTLDTDDVLEPTGVAKVLSELHAHPTAVFGAGRARWLDASGATLRPAATEFAEGRSWVRPGAYSSFFNEHDHAAWVSSATVVRRDVALEHGGWSDLPQGEDLAMLRSVTDAAPGLYSPRTLLGYRRWAGALTAESRCYFEPPAVVDGVTEPADPHGIFAVTA